MLKGKRGAKNRSAQAATETILIMSLIVTFLLFIVVLDNQILTGTDSDYNVKKMKFTMESLVQISDLEYSQGRGAKTKVLLSIPKHVESIVLGNRTINVTMNITGEKTELFRKFKYDINGNMPTDEGTYLFTIESGTGHVNISYEKNS